MDFGFQPYPLYSNKIHCLKAITVSLMQLRRALHSTVYTDVKQTLIAQESQGWLPSLHYMALLVVRGSSDVLVALVVLSSILIGTSNASSTSGSSTRSASTTSSTNSTSSTAGATIFEWSWKWNMAPLETQLIFWCPWGYLNLDANFQICPLFIPIPLGPGLDKA